MLGHRITIYPFTPLILTLLLLTACTKTPEKKAELVLGQSVYEANCATCHGFQGEGQPNWKEVDENGLRPAPPHDATGHTWHHSDSLLLEIIAKGSAAPGSTMLGYENVLSQEEMKASLEYIKTFWGKEELEFQEQVSRRAGG